MLQPPSVEQETETGTTTRGESGLTTDTLNATDGEETKAFATQSTLPSISLDITLRTIETWPEEGITSAQLQMSTESKL